MDRRDFIRRTLAAGIAIGVAPEVADAKEIGTQKAVPAGRMPLQGSVRPVFHHLPVVGKPNAREKMEVCLILRHNPAAGELPSLEELGAQKPHERRYFSYEAFEQKYGTDPQDVVRVEDFAHEYNLKVEESDASQRTVKLSGTVKDVSAAFGVALGHYQYSEGICLGHTQEVSLPAGLEQIIRGICGLETFPVARPSQVHGKDRGISGPKGHVPAKHDPADVAKLYNFPAGMDGKGQCIGLVQLGGGYSTDVLKTYFDHMGIPMPQISTGGGENNYTDGNSPEEYEVMLDIEVVGCVAPGAQIVVYFGSSYTEALNLALKDKENNPSIVSISWGSPEVIEPATDLALFDEMASEAALKGITLCAASGDNGSNISNASTPLGFVNNLAITNFPACHPGVLGCGGTELTVSDEKIEKEIVWNFLGFVVLTDPAHQKLPVNGGASGGGVSLIYPIPDYQKSVDIPGAADRTVFIPSYVGQSLHSSREVLAFGRGVPDVAGNAIGYKTLVRSGIENLEPQSGTSAVSPLMAALVARLNQGLGKRVGHLNPILYNLKPGAFRQITQGSNGSYYAHPDLKWNACTGLGVPEGTELLAQLRSHFE